MEPTNEKESYWNLSAHKTAISATALENNASTEVCIVGAGITGLTAAYELLRLGVDVIVVDAREHGTGESFRTTAHLTYVLDKRYFELGRIHGLEKAKAIAKSHMDAIQTIQDIVESKEMDCEFKRVDGYLLASPRFSKFELEKELEYLHKMGFHHAALLDQSPLKGFDALPCLKFPYQAQIHPQKYLDALLEQVICLGGKFYSETRIDDLSDNAPVKLRTDKGHTITADYAILASDAPIASKVSLVHKLAPYRTYVIGGEILKGSVPNALYWDTEEPYHYVRVEPGKARSATDLLLIGGDDHRVGQPVLNEDYFRDLEEWTKKRFPQFKAVDFKWSGQIMEPIDGVAYIGRDYDQGPNIFVATGYSGNGLTYGTIAGLLLTDLITGHENALQAIYDPERIRVGATGTNIRENLNSASQYKDWFTKGDAKSLSEVGRGEGHIMRDGLKKIAVYRDKTGDLHCMSATCTHLGGIVRWNDVEKTWDCPCHGSRFDCHGKVIHGPATHDLHQAEPTNAGGVSPTTPSTTGPTPLGTEQWDMT